MLSRFGLRARMAASYVLVSAAALLVVEVVVLTLVVPTLRSASDTVEQANHEKARAERGEARAKAEGAAAEDAAELSLLASRLMTERPGITDTDLLSAVAEEGFESTALSDAQRRGELAPGDVEVLTTPGGQVVATSSERDVPNGSVLPTATGWPNRPVAVAEKGAGSRVVGIVHTHLTGSAPEADAGGTTKSRTGTTAGDAGADDAGTLAGGIDVERAVLLPGLVVLALIVPVGVLFGLLSTGPLIRRIRRLAEGTATMAGGDLQARVPVSGADEVGRLEAGFNWMAERLDTAVRAERDAAGADARREERTRIARELHDSVSQHLFSLNLLAGGLRRALPEGSELRHQAESMERTVNRTMREMRAMLLELRPVALEDAGLVAAVEELCRAYEVRLGIRVTADVTELNADPAVEHAVLRVVQEALANAARHGEADVVELRVADVHGHVVVAIRDHGRGFDPARVGERHGMGLDLMRERVVELGGTVDVSSAPSRGTTVQVRIPAGVP
jgi:signal transduction histidine kinase